MSELELFAEKESLIEEQQATIIRLQRLLTKAKAKEEAMVKAVWDAARDATLALGPVNPIPAPALLPHSGKPEVSLWDLGDWQGSKVTTSYNSDVMVERVMRFCKKAQYITEIQRNDHPVNDCVILFGGDMVEGLFNFPTQVFEIDATLFTQFTRVSRLLIDVVRYALTVYNHVTVIAEWGNHGRIGSKRDAVPKNDNVDRMCYEFARQMLANEPRLTWEDCPEDIQYFEIGNYSALNIHGDEIGRMGYASQSTLIQWANRQRSGAFPKPFRDIYIHHYHTHYELAMANGEGALYGTGSTESDNRYARDNLAASATPSQRLHFIDPDKGRVTSQYKIHLLKEAA